MQRCAKQWYMYSFKILLAKYVYVPTPLKLTV